MSAVEMSSSAAKLPAYQRLRPDSDDDDDFDYEIKKRVLVGSNYGPMSSGSRKSLSNSWCRLKFRRVQSRRRSFKLKVPSLRRFWVLRKAKLMSALIRGSCAKVVKRFKEGQNHFGDLFAGNYLFLQVAPSSLKCLDKAKAANQLQFSGLPSRKIGY